MKQILQSKTSFEKLNKVLLTILFGITSQIAFSQVSGKVFNDFNLNGTQQTINPVESGVGGVTVTAFNDAGASVSVTTASDGSYSFPNSGITASGQKLRIEFSNFPSFMSENGTGNSSTQFVTAGAAATGKNIALSYPNNYCQTNPIMVTPCYVESTTSGLDVMAKWSYNNEGTAPLDEAAISQSQMIGSTWGVAYDRVSKKVYASAVLKAHVPLGPEGLDAIYIVDPNSSANGTKFIELTDDLGIAVSSTSAEPQYLTNAARGLNNPAQNDAQAFSDVGKVGLGDIEISADGKTLYVMNLFDKKLYAIDIATKTLVGTYPVSKTCTGGTSRPWAITEQNGKIFIGVICDGSTSGNTGNPLTSTAGVSNLSATIYRLDGSTFTQVLTYSLAYPRENPFEYSGTCDQINSWKPWIDAVPQTCDDGNVAYPTPILTDIEFDDNGNMIMGFTDRTGFQYGFENYGPTGTTLRGVYSGGDILRACVGTGGNFNIESVSGGCASTTGGPGNNGGQAINTNDPTGYNPAGAKPGEFFWGDYFHGDGDLLGNTSWFPGHPEITIGGLAVVPGTGEVMSTSYDPVAGSPNYNTGGVISLSTITGARSGNGFQLYKSNAGDPTQGKGVGLGDLEALCNPAPIELGNRLWFDADEDGVQDPGEIPLPWVQLTLYASDGTTPLGTATTDANGEWVFNTSNVSAGILPNTDYVIKVTTPLNSGALATYKSFTKVDQTSATVTDLADSDASALGVINLKTGLPGENNNTLDIGLTKTLPIGSIGDFVWTDTNNNGQQDGTEAPIAGVKVYLLDGTGNKIDSTVTDNLGKYLFDSLLSGIYQVQFVAPAGTITAKQNTGTDVSDSDANSAGLSQMITIDTSKLPTDTLRNNPQIDAGFVPVGSLGDFVFNDKNGNGIQDATDTPIVGLKVYLLDATSGAKLDSTVTDALGKYSFDSLLAGSYKVKFEIPAGSEITTKTAGTDPALDSNVNPDGTTDVITINTTLPVGNIGRDNPTIDAGIKPAYGSIGDFVWTDTNNNGQQDGTEAPIAGVKVYLLDGTGNKIDSTVTDNLGKYLFDSLASGTYQVQFVAPAGTIAAKQNTGADVSDSDANSAGLSQLITIDTAKLPTDTLRNNPQIDAGFVPVGSIGDYVFEDKDNSNTQTAGDSPLAGVKVYLLDATTGAKLDSTTTDINGLYLFDSLVAGNYKVQFVAPSGTMIVSKNSGTDVAKDSNPDPTTGITDAVTIDTTQSIGDPARDNRDVDAGVKLIPQYGSLGDYVWMDTNNNGQQDGTETPIAGVKVYLYDGTGTTILDSTVTDALGKYTFDSLITGAYKVKFEAPAGTLPASQNTGADVTDSDANLLGWSQVVNINTSLAATDTLRHNPQIDAGFVPFGSIGDYVFEDKDNSNTQTAGDLPIQGVKVYLLDATTGAKLDSTFTDANGLYKFDSLLAGDYKVQFLVPPGMLAVTPNSGTDDTKDSDINSTGLTGTYTVDTTKPVGDPARDITSVDAGLKGVPQFGSIGDYVWSDVNNNGQQDGTEAPIAGVKVYLLDAVSGSIIDSTVTDAAGKYLFDSLLTGSYKVQFVAPAGTIPAKQNTGADVTDSDANTVGLSHVININTALTPTDTLRNNPQIDAGFVPLGSIGDYVFEDKDKSNTQTAGDTPISGVTVYLLDATTGAKLDSTITDANGLYLFDSLVAGNYKVQFVAPSGTSIVTKNSGTDVTKDSNPDPTTGITDAVTIDTTQPIGDPARDNRDVDAGVNVLPQYGSLGDYVWMDTNNNGQQDGTETPIAGVKVYLYDGTGTTILDSTVTDALGKYTFDSLITGAYKVKFEAPAGTLPASQNIGPDVTDSDANSLGWSQVVNINTSLAATDTLRNNPQIDAGFVPFGSIGDYIFEDKDNSNTQTAGDLPIPGVKVYLLDATTGAKLDSTITDANGIYKFDSLLAGDYKVQFLVPPGMLAVTKDSGTDDTKDSDINSTGLTGTYTVDTTKPVGDPARDITSVDAGLKGVPQFGSIGDYVWSDVNNNGQQDGTEAPIAGVKVYLLDAVSGSIIDSTVTDAAGKYLFDSLLTGSYKVQFVAPAGTIPAKQNNGADVTDSDANTAGLSQVININTALSPTDTLRNNPQIDAGFVPLGSIGDYVFEDKDKSNTQTAGDTPISGVTVYLLDATTGAKLDSTSTDANGLYLFDSLVAGNYKVQFIAPSGTSIVTKNSGTDVAKDSNPDPTTGITDAVTIDTTKPIGDPARDNRDVDAGINILPQYGSLGDYVWMDTNNNGQQDGTETPIAGVKVYLYDGTGTSILDSTVTDALGKYTFDSLITGAYKVKFEAPAGTLPASQNTGADITDSDANSLGWSQVVNINTSLAATDTLRNNPQIDAGFVPFGSIGDYVFNDKDNSNTQTTGDEPIPGVKVYLLDATTGAKLDSTFTDQNGLYKFDSLLAGNYKVQFDIPVGLTAVTTDSGTDDTKDSDINPTGTTGVYTVDTSKPVGDPARDITSVDAGLKGVAQYGSLGDYVWYDVNNNGQQEGTEAPIAGVNVYLYDGSGTTILDSTVTDALGKYTFDSLLSGSYKVKFEAPDGTIPSKQNIGADVSDSDANSQGWSQVINIDVTKTVTDTLRNNPQIDAGFVPVGSIGDYVFEDKDNSNTQTAGDNPVPCIKVYLLDAVTGTKLDSTVTDAAGKYLFYSLVAGNYKIQFVAPSGTNLVTKTSGTDVTKDSNPDPTTGITDTVTIDTTQPIGSATRDNRDVDAGLKINGPFGSLGDYVWLDVNNNGQQDGTEAPIAGVKVYLYDATMNMLIDSTVTDALGKYTFDSLLTGKYQVQFVAPAGTFPAKQNLGADVTDSDANKLGFSQIIDIDTSKPVADTLRNNPQIDAGFVPFGSLGDYVFQDKDGSNTQTAGDTPVPGVKVYLLDATTGAKLDSTLTDGNGLYKFDSLLAGNYKVQFVAPIGSFLVTQAVGGDPTKDSNPDTTTGITDTVTIDTTQPIGSVARDNMTVDAGIIPQKQFGSIGDYVWMDTNNNGQQDGTEAPIAGVIVYLYDASGSTILDSTVTDAAGKYLFDSLISGSYKVFFKAPAGTIAAKQNTGSDLTDSDANNAGWSQVVNIDVTKATTDTLRNNPQIDAGFVPVGSIGDYVFQDVDGSNTQTSGDIPVQSVKVYLLDATTGAILDSTVTDAIGKYLFDSLLAGNYKVQFIAPSGSLLVTKTAGSDPTKDSNPDTSTGITDAVTIDTTQPIGSVARDNMTVDAGIVPQKQYGSLGDYVWMDTNNNGQQDGTEAPISGVKVYLYDGSGTTILDSTVTDAAGKYMFDSLVTGAYKVFFQAPAGTIAAKQNTGSDVSDSDANKAGWSQVVNIDATKADTDKLRNNPQIDGGFVPVGSIGDYVFQDKDGSNTQTAGDTPVPGVKVYLLDAATGAKLDSTVTDGTGLYKFDSLVAGNYKVQFIAPSGSLLVTKAAGTDSTKDSNPDPTTGITDVVNIDTTQPLGSVARDNMTVDAGIVPQKQFGSMGDFVWMDTNNNGQQDPTEAPIAGVKVFLYDATGTSIIDSTVTDAAGKYLFDSLLSGAYKVYFKAPTGTIVTTQNSGSDLTDSDANKAGWSQVVNIDVNKAVSDTLRNNPQIDAGFVPVGSIGDYVFLDLDNSKTQTLGDTPVAGVKVYLLDAITGAKLDSTFTDANGKYLFDSLLAGNYKVQFIAPIGQQLVTPDSGTDDTKDSDPNASTGITSSVNVDTTKPLGDPLRNITTVDAGLAIQYGSIGDTVWVDANANGLQDLTEAPLAGVKVYLLDGSGNKLDSTVTDAAGKYLFDSLVSGTYKVQFVAPAGTKLTTANAGANDAKDSDANQTTGITGNYIIDTTFPSGSVQRDNRTVDAGIVPLGSVGNYVWFDLNKDGIQDANETGVSGVKVYLLNNLGVKIDSTVTNGSGLYLFDSLLSGTYKVQFVKPAGFDAFTGQNIGTNDAVDSDANISTGISDVVTINTTLPAGSQGRDNRDIDAGLVMNQTQLVDVELTKTTNAQCQVNVDDIITFTVKVFRKDNSSEMVTLSVKDSLTSNLTYVSHTITEGTFNANTGMWSGISIAKGDTATITMRARVMTSMGGLACNTAWVQSQDKVDIDSQAGNQLNAEDDIAKACVSLPILLCSAKGEKIELLAPAGYAGYVWKRNGVVIQGATSNVYLASQSGSYTIEIPSLNTCSVAGCCPIIITDFCDCKDEICIPFNIKKTK